MITFFLDDLKLFKLDQVLRINRNLTKSPILSYPYTRLYYLRKQL